MAQNLPKLKFRTIRGQMMIQITCPQCSIQHEQPFKALPAGSVLPCNCGLRIEISGDGLAAAQRALDDLKKSFKRLR